VDDCVASVAGPLHDPNSLSGGSAHAQERSVSEAQQGRAIGARVWRNVGCIRPGRENALLGSEVLEPQLDRQYDIGVSRVRRIYDWLSYGALGPTLALAGGAAVLTSVRLFGLDHTQTAKYIDLAIAVAGVVAIVCGSVLTVRPTFPYWLAIVAIALPVGADLTRDVAVQTQSGAGRVVDAIQWAIIGVLIGFYAYHCHRPAYSREIGLAGLHETRAESPAATPLRDDPA